MRSELRAAQERDCNKLELDKRAADRSVQSFQLLKARGLPSETAAIAGVQYQEYLMRALQQCGMQSRLSMVTTH